jgi:two-component system cell cycle response regulator DivK
MAAYDGREGLELVAHRTPDLILMDINLPEMDGYEVTGKMRQLPALQNTPIIALTANIMRDDRQKSLNAGCDGYIPKPIDIDKLPKQILGFLGRGL